MWNSILIIFLAVFAWGVLHSILASIRAKAQARLWMGPAADRIYRLGYNALSVITIFPVLGLIAVLPDRPLYQIPPPWVILTTLGQGLAVVLLIIGLLQTGVWSFLGFEQLGAGEPQPDEFVVNGLYRWVRHPLYSAGLLFIWLTPLMTLNLFALNVGLTVYILIGAYFEERKLRRVFGPAYASYQRTTPMLIPGLRLRG